MGIDYNPLKTNASIYIILLNHMKKKNGTRVPRILWHADRWVWPVAFGEQQEQRQLRLEPRRTQPPRRNKINDIDPLAPEEERYARPSSPSKSPYFSWGGAALQRWERIPRVCHLQKATLLRQGLFFTSVAVSHDECTFIFMFFLFCFVFLARFCPLDRVFLSICRQRRGLRVGRVGKIPP